MANAVFADIILSAFHRLGNPRVGSFAVVGMDVGEIHREHEAAGVAARWPAAGENAWVGTPGMNACVKAMAEPLDVRWSLRAERLQRDGAHWRVAASCSSCIFIQSCAFIGAASGVPKWPVAVALAALVLAGLGVF